MTADGRAGQPLCCEGSLEAGEPLLATAPRVDVWLALEYNAAWGAKALAESRLPAAVKAFLEAQAAAIPNARFQFIKQERQSTNRDGLRFYAARSEPGDAALYRFDLAAYDDLLRLDMSAVANGAAAYASSRVDESLFLVCSNGKRDLSCARYGLPLYGAMSRYAGQTVWQTTHLGGHRFAGTLACLPEGLYYGRVRPDEAAHLVDEHHAGRIDLDHYRGRSAYDAPAQAAEHFVREQTGIRDIDGLKLVDAVAMGDNQWRAQFSAPIGRFDVRVSSRLSDFEIYESTANSDKNRVTLYQMEAYETGTAHPNT